LLAVLSAVDDGSDDRAASLALVVSPRRDDGARLRRMEVDATRIRRAEKKRAIERQRAEVAALRSRVAAGRGAKAPRPPRPPPASPRKDDALARDAARDAAAAFDRRVATPTRETNPVLAAVDAAAVAAAAAPAKKQSLVARIGESGALSYVGINVVWYSVGVNVFLYGMPLATGGGLSLAAKRFGAAWGLCFVASQWSAALRMGLAAALAPTTAKILAALRRRLPSGAPRWVAPVLALAGLVAAFAANAAAALLREVVRVSAVA
jgi:hypothetical protein